MAKNTAMLRGVFPAITTPFHEDGRVDALSLQSNMAIWNSKGVRGYLLLGSTGEVAHLDRGEKLAVLEAARAAIPYSAPMIVGTGVHSTQATIAFTKRAAELGATYALVVTPHYFKRDMTNAVLRNYFEAVAEASPIPVLLYNVPQFTGIQMVPELIAILSQHPNIVGIKDSSGDMRALIKTLSLVEKDFAVLVGSALVLYPSLLTGATGAILAVANFAAEACMEIYSLVEEEREVESEEVIDPGDQRVRKMHRVTGNFAGRKRARALQEKILNITETVAGYGIGGIKYAMSCLGFSGGYVRSPLIMPDEAEQKVIRDALRSSGLFKNQVIED